MNEECGAHVEKTLQIGFIIGAQKRCKRNLLGMWKGYTARGKGCHGYAGAIALQP